MYRGCGRRSNEEGFTIIEVIIVAVVIGLLAAIAIPNIDLSRYRIDNAMRSVGTSLQAAQRRAVTRQHDVIVLIDATASTIRVHEDVNNNQTHDTGELIRAFPMGDQVLVGLGNAPPHPIGAGPVTFTKQVDGVPAVTFHRNGSASELGGVYLTSRRAVNTGAHPDDTRLLEVERATGRVSWWRYLAGSWKREF